MSFSRTEIQPLPADVATKIKSSTSITHLNGVILELAKNALDAGAKAIHISVDFKRGGCIVEDDGDGIPPAEFESTGGLGKAHHTSRFQQTGKFGHRGLFLCSLGALSLLTVTSRRIQHQATNSLIVHQSRPVARLIPAPEHHNLQYSDHGTCVTVNDLFGNMPVRVKSRALALQRSDELDREWDRLRYSLVSLALANSQLLRLVVTDERKSKRISIRLDGSMPDLDLNTPEHEVDLSRIGSILAQSGMINSGHLDSWHVISAKIPDLTISAAMSTIPSPSKKVQFISLGHDPVLSQGSSNILFNEINHLVSSSDFDLSGVASRSTSATCLSPAPELSDAPNSLRSKAWAKPINKWPMFYIRIDMSTIIPINDDVEEVSPGSEKSIQRITNVLEAMITEFLKQQDMHPRISRRKGRALERERDAATGQSRSRSSSKQRGVRPNSEESFANGLKLPSFHQLRAVNASQNLNNWSRVKTAKDLNDRSFLGRNLANVSDVDVSPLVSRPRDEPTPGKYAATMSSTISFRPSCSVEHGRGTDQNQLSVDNQQTADEMIPWVDRRTGKVHMINSRTGQTVNPTVSAVRSRPDLPISGDNQGNLPGRNVWVENILKAWNNPTFTRTEMPLPIFDLETTSFDVASSTHHSFHDIGALAAAQVTKFKGKLWRQSLATATIIAQVDKKYILAKLNDTHLQATDDQEAVLVLIDQHAADERCRIEQLFDEMFVPTESVYETQARTAEIDSMTFKISSTEAVIFKKYIGLFGDWGIQYEVKEESGSEAAVLVKSLPALIAERCRLEPGLVIELLRREIWTNEEGNGRPSGPTMASASKSLYDDENPTPHSWVQKMSGCPQIIFDLLNSRACRSAIMFNDPLSIDECRNLVSRLSRCAFPFQCAHGRPSMIPILDLRPQPGSLSEALYEHITTFDYDEHYDSGLDFKQAFQARYDN